MAVTMGVSMLEIALISREFPHMVCSAFLQLQLQLAPVTHSLHIYTIALTNTSFLTLSVTCLSMYYHCIHIYSITAYVPYWGTYTLSTQHCTLFGYTYYICAL